MGVSGFIGSCMLTALNESGYERDIVVVDEFWGIRKQKATGLWKVEALRMDPSLAMFFLDWFERQRA
ncbi:MAG: hypothetical protein IPJ39_12545 [Saprospiraceae bacterium]|nr:hypothetical protein [Saprospiraceae bacterium]